jgi:M6 family metalloprotease-like protein
MSRYFIALAVALFAFSKAFAASYNGEPMQLSQPDGSEVTVHLYGTSFFSTAESPDGYTLIRDKDGWIYYAELSVDESELVSTGVRYTAASFSPTARKGLRINEKAMMEQRGRNVKALGDGEEESLNRFWNKAERHERRRAARESSNPSAPDDENEILSAPPEVVGLALFISFPDFPGPTGAVNDRWLRHADSVYNSPAYTRGNGAGYGSVYNYFQDISDGAMSVKNYVSVFVQAPNTFEYYDGVDNYGRVQELITAALNSLNQNTAVANEIANRLSRHPGTFGQKTRPAYALNIHPIRSGQRWSHGIWSHRGWYRGAATVGGVPFYDYQFSGLGNAGTITNNSTLSTNVIIHENGHMLFDWPDLYSYNSGRNFVVGYCAMSSGTVMPNPYFRDLEGWLTVTDVTNAPGLYTHEANSNTAFRFSRTDVTGNNANRERYYIESRFGAGRSTGIPGSGLIVWHIHTSGDNANYDPNSGTANRRTPRVAIVQANNGTGNPNAQATFINTSGRNLFNRLPGDNSTPQRRWHTQNGGTGELWGGASGTGGTNSPVSGLVISEISAAPTTSNPRMTFRVGTGGSTPSSSSVGSSSSSSSSLTVTVTCTLPNTLVTGTSINNATQRGYLRCSNTNAAPTQGNNPTWTGTPRAPISGGTVAAAGAYTNIGVSVNCGTTANPNNVSGTCNNITISNSFTCTGLVATGTVGATFAAPTVRCNGTTVTNNLTWTPAGRIPTSTGSVAVSVSRASNASSCAGMTAQCGNITVSAPSSSSVASSSSSSEDTPSSSSSESTPSSSSSENTSSSSSSEDTPSSSSEGTTSILSTPHTPYPIPYTPIYYNLKGEPLGTTKPTTPGIYIEMFKDADTRRSKVRRIVIQ